jgi:two-component system, sensor histidine kinase and response regulator
MLEVERKLTGRNPSAERADELFAEQQQEIYRNTDQLFARLMFCQWLGAIVIALIVSPLTWAGQSSAIHIHVWAAIFLGGAISIFPIWMTRVWPGAAITRYVIAVAQMLMSALLISVTGGRIETHFHVFGSLVILSFYRDWRVLIPATIVVALDHFVRGIYWPYSVYGVLTATPWRSIEHAAWVVFEDVFLVISCLRSIREMRSIANRTAALEASEQGFRQIFEEGPIGIAVVDLDQRFVKVNPSVCQMMGYSEEELLQRNTLELTHPDDVSNDQGVAKSLREGASRCSFEKRYLRKDKELLWVTLTASIIRDKNGEPHHYLTMMKDISERKRVEQALHAAKEEADRANRAKSEFLSRMSHELRTPLNAILGFGQLLERQEPTEVQKNRVGHIMNAGRHLLNLINEILDIARVESGRLQFSLEPVLVEQAVDEAIDLVRPLAAERKIQIERTDLIGPSPSVLADRQRLKQVLLNLLANAVKYNRDAGRVIVDLAPQPDQRFRISISDEGSGIPADKRGRLFSPFDRLGAELTASEGTGLGLALSKRLVETMGGAIGESAPASGSCFWIEFPLVKGAVDRLDSSRIATTQLLTLDGEVKTLLYIEDNLSNLSLVEHLLGECPPIKLISAMQGLLGLELAQRHKPDLILLDVHLPDIGGAEVLARLRAEQLTRDIPVVVLSADATKSQVDRLLAAGANGYLTKPLDVDHFVKVIEGHFREATSVSSNGNGT